MACIIKVQGFLQGGMQQFEGYFIYVAEQCTCNLFAFAGLEPTSIIGQFIATDESKFNLTVFEWVQVTNPTFTVIKGNLKANFAMHSRVIQDLPVQKPQYIGLLAFKIIKK
jgi:hypothetical protein